MKYLVGFNESKESLYKEITQDEYSSSNENIGSDPWYQSEIHKVINIILNVNRHLWYKHNDYGHHLKIEYDKNIPNIFASFILKLKDDWFIVWMKNSNKFYKCDGMDGLLLFIQENKELWK